MLASLSAGMFNRPLSSRHSPKAKVHANLASRSLGRGLKPKLQRTQMGQQAGKQASPVRATEAPTRRGKA